MADLADFLRWLYVHAPAEDYLAALEHAAEFLGQDLDDLGEIVSAEVLH